MLCAEFKSLLLSKSNLKEDKIPVVNYFHGVIPALTITHIDYMVVHENRVKKTFALKHNKDLVVAEDGFAAGVAFLLHVLNGWDSFFAMNWFESYTISHLRIPNNTILLVDFAEEFRLEGQRIQKANKHPAVVRILDAAVLYGDDVSQLPYEQRMKAAQKFAKALKLTNRQVKEGWGRMEHMITPQLTVAAHVYSLSEIQTFRENLKEGIANRELGVLFEEDGFSFKCHGLRFIRIIKQEWQMGWSKSQQRPYAHSPEHKSAGSVPELDWQAKQIYATFWETAIITNKDKDKMNERIKKSEGSAVPVPSMKWSWKASIRTPYGPEKIINYPEAFEGNPTVAALKKHIDTTDSTAHRNRH
uniref:Cap-specific mRNA (nucleoside-2'-O-)-methyltransferase 1 n=1 Tax=Caenorhabditis japonica TaxID=281687 RepID=A0A8R1HSZ3_CAEJA